MEAIIVLAVVWSSPVGAYNSGPRRTCPFAAPLISRSRYCRSWCWCGSCQFSTAEAGAATLWKPVYECTPRGSVWSQLPTQHLRIGETSKNQVCLSNCFGGETLWQEASGLSCLATPPLPTWEYWYHNLLTSVIHRLLVSQYRDRGAFSICSGVLSSGKERRSRLAY